MAGLDGRARMGAVGPGNGALEGERGTLQFCITKWVSDSYGFSWGRHGVNCGLYAEGDWYPRISPDNQTA